MICVMQSFFVAVLAIVASAMLLPLSIASEGADAKRLKSKWESMDANADGVLEASELHPI